MTRRLRGYQRIAAQTGRGFLAALHSRDLSRLVAYYPAFFRDSPAFQGAPKHPQRRQNSNGAPRSQAAMTIEASGRFIFPYISRHFRPSCVILAAHHSQNALKFLDMGASRPCIAVANHCQNRDSRRACRRRETSCNERDARWSRGRSVRSRSTHTPLPCCARQRFAAMDRRPWAFVEHPLQARRRPERCVISTPCCACAISMSR